MAGSLALVVIMFSELAFALDPQITVYIYFGGLFLAYVTLFITRRGLRKKGVNC